MTIAKHSTVKNTIEGGTDGTIIGNTGDRLNVDAEVSTSPVPLNNIIYSLSALSNGFTTNMNVNGSVTPVNFDFTPASGETWYISSLATFLLDNGSTLPRSFGVLTALTNGVEIRIRSEGTEYLVATLHNNMEVQLVFKEFPWIPGTSGFNESSDIYCGQLFFPVPVKLQNSTADFIRIRIRDNLTGVDQFRSTVKVWRQI